MKNAWLCARSAVLWSASGAFFLLAALTAIAASFLVDNRRLDGWMRLWSRIVVFLAGARWEGRYSPGFDPTRVCFFVPNHVNLFDPFMLCPAIPQHVRGLELESHFSIPIYGWLMRRCGNIAVPVLKNPSDLKRMWRSAKAALDAGTSLAVFPEGSRTRTGEVGPFKDGVFRMAVEFGCPIVPVTIAGSFALKTKLSWLLRPATVVVHVHETIETKGLSREDVPALSRRVHAIVSRALG